MTTTDRLGNRHEDATGRFADKHNSRPAGGLAAASAGTGAQATEIAAAAVGRAPFAEAHVAHFVGDQPITTVRPESYSTLRRELSRRRTHPQSVRVVQITAVDYPRQRGDDRDIEVTPPRQSDPLLIDVVSGLPRLKVTGPGKVIADLRSSWGNSLTVHHPDAHATVLARRGVKTTLTVSAGRLTIVDVDGADRVSAHGPLVGRDDGRNIFDDSVIERLTLAEYLERKAGDAT